MLNLSDMSKEDNLCMYNTFENLAKGVQTLDTNPVKRSLAGADRIVYNGTRGFALYFLKTQAPNVNK